VLWVPDSPLHREKQSLREMGEIGASNCAFNIVAQYFKEENCMKHIENFIFLKDFRGTVFSLTKFKYFVIKLFS